ncbi:glucosaminidase domain-containing protein [Alicyclobacillus acidiphilus]|uniref:glucosaminidase domain-containing protein n=1 Tax=Alicyclobacillus acidiphilus TaxID=182455 RepID=UPI00082C0771|nr:glucosaminidase domain-containing protein [Alicyclobacillus acidiphilus]
MNAKWTAIAVGSAAVVCSVLSPKVTVNAANFAMQTKSIQLNGEVLSRPSGFVYQGTTYLPVFYVQQLLNSLKLQNKWNGSVWQIATPFANQPSSTLKTKSGSVVIEINQKVFAAHVQKVVTADPSSHKNTTFIPIWYIIQTLQAIGLQSTWNGAAWNVKVSDSDYTKTGTLLGSFSTLADAKAALAQYPGGTVRDVNGQTVWTEPSFVDVDLRYPAPSDVTAAAIDKYLTAHNSLMAGLGSVFMEAQAKYDVDANYLVSHALEETGSGGSVSEIALKKNNLFGYGAFDANATADAGTFPSEAYAILFQAWEVRNDYLNPDSSHYTKPTLAGMAANYASDPEWANKINNLMDQFAIDVGDTVQSYHPYDPSNQPPVPIGVTSPPVYILSGMSATVKVDPFYGDHVPVYSSAGLGHQHMFGRVLKQGDQGDDVQTLQQALGITADGQFGAQTAQAVESYQSAHNLGGTPGQVDLAMWNSLNLTQAQATVQSGTTVGPDEIVQGMVGGQVTEWYHVPSLNAWVNANDIVLNNVYRVAVSGTPKAANASIPVLNAQGKNIGSLHVGDYVVSDDQFTSGRVAVQWNNQATGAAETGYISAEIANLVKVDE